MAPKNNNRGFSLILIILLIVVMGAVVFVAMRVMSQDSYENESSNNQKNQTQDSVKKSEDTLELQNFGLVSMDSVDVAQNAVRDFDAQGRKGLYIFGDKLPGGNRSNPNFEFASLKEGTQVVAATDGVISFIRQQSESNDYEVFLQTQDKSVWIIGYDHLTNLKVKKGDTVKAGTVLGEPARQNDGMLRFEIQINKEESGNTQHYCPSLLLASSVKEKVLADFKAMLMDWESQTGKELYAVESQNPVGCMGTTLTPAQAEGRQ